MSRIVAMGLSVLVLAACKPADLATPPEPVTPPAAAAPAPQPPAAASWEATQERYRQVDIAPSDPVEALEWRGVLCEHYSGEFGGDGSDRDQWLNTQMDKLKCGDELAAEARAMRDARSGEPIVVTRLNAVLAASAQ